MPSLVATTSALAHKPCVRTHYVHANNAKFSGHYVSPRTHAQRLCARNSARTKKVLKTCIKDMLV